MTSLSLLAGRTVARLEILGVAFLKMTKTTNLRHLSAKMQTHVVIR